MIKAVLLDLDDTLLGNPTRRFTETYLGLLDRFLHERLGIPSVIGGLMAGTRAVVFSQDPLRTNWDVFYEVLDPTLTVSRQDFDAVVEDFYRTDYAQLQSYTAPRTESRPLVDWLIAQGYAVAVATSPFFPRTAIEQRLTWAGVSPQQVPFALVTTLENMHYAKPNPAYYEEILARIGVQADEAIMVGDDWENDMLAAARAGLNTFWIVPPGQQPDPAAPIQPDGFGTLADFACRAQQENWFETLAPQPHTVEQVIPRLNGNLAAVFGIVREAPEHSWHKHPDQQEWSPIEVLCHLWESERDVQRPRLLKIQAEDNPFLSQPKAPPGPLARPCPGSPLGLAQKFAVERQTTLTFLTGLAPEDWQRPARHTIFGPTTLLEMAHFTAQHDRLHLTQLCQTIGKCH
ncbi:MAG: HAD-IA family hydrolase [Chloroflexi bacterium]|nr:HAD-IA family hydrolase [Chloroflexota bacterium]